MEPLKSSIWIVTVLALGCGQKRERTDQAGHKTGPAAPKDAVVPDALHPVDAAPTLAELEPKVPPPAPTVKQSKKGDCKTEYAPTPTRDPNPMCKIDGGTFMMGAPESDRLARDIERPAHLVTLSPYYLDQFEVTVAQIVHYMNATHRNDCEKWGDSLSEGRCFSFSGDIELVGGEYRAKPDMAALAFNGAGYQGAALYCEWVGKRLPSEAEWEFAARHDPKTGKDRRYPWGDRFEARRANCDEEACKDGFITESPVGSFDGTGGFLDGSSPWGVHDLAGNVGEIVADCERHPYEPCEGPCRDPLVASRPGCKRMVRTSSWTSDDVDLRATWRLGGPGGGFRCAR